MQEFEPICAIKTAIKQNSTYFNFPEIPEIEDLYESLYGHDSERLNGDLKYIVVCKCKNKMTSNSYRIIHELQACTWCTEDITNNEVTLHQKRISKSERYIEWIKIGTFNTMKVEI